MANEDHLKFLLEGGSTWLTWRHENRNAIPDFSGHNFKNVSFRYRPVLNANFDNTTFDDADLSVADFSGSSFCTSRFKNADLTAARFIGCKLINVVFEDCKLEKTNFSNALLENVKFIRTNLVETYFDGATLANIQLVRSTLKDVNLLNTTIVTSNKLVLLKNKQRVLQLIEAKKARLKKVVRGRDDKKGPSIEDLENISHSIDLEKSDLVKLQKKLSRRLEVFRNNKTHAKAIEEELKELKRKTKKSEYEQRRIKRRIKKASGKTGVGSSDFDRVSPRKVYPERNEPDEGIERVVDKEEIDQIDVCVYASPTVKSAEPIMVQVWLHQPKFANEVEAEALMYDFEATKRGEKSLLLIAPKGTEFTLLLTCPQLGYEEAIDTIWNGQKLCETFVVNTPEEIRQSALFMTVEIYQGGLPVGKINIKMRVVSSNYPNKADKKETLGRSKKYEKAFISYSSKDREEVLARVQGIKLTDMYEIFQDVLSLEEGERWNPRIYKEIESSDVFFLFWSAAARDSEWVKKELEYALKCKEGVEENHPKIQPVVLPPRVDPPESLGFMHFNDSIVQFIMAERFRKNQEQNN